MEVTTVILDVFFSGIAASRFAVETLLVIIVISLSIAIICKIVSRIHNWRWE